MLPYIRCNSVPDLDEIKCETHSWMGHGPCIFYESFITGKLIYFVTNQLGVLRPGTSSHSYENDNFNLIDSKYMMK